MEPQITCRKGSRANALVLVLPFLFATAIPSPAAPAGEAADFYLAPGGDDHWSGTLPTPMRSGATAPLPRSSAPAMPCVNSVPERPRPAGHGEAPRRDISPIAAVGVAARGFRKRGRPNRLRGLPGEKPVLSGGKPVSGWKPAEGPLWKAELPEVKRRAGSSASCSSTASAAPAPAAQGRHVHRGRPAGQMDTSSWMGAGPEAKSRVGQAGVPVQAGRHPQGLDQPGRRRSRRAPVLDGGPAAHQAPRREEPRRSLFTGGSWRPLTWSGGYYVENVFEGLDAPGSWYLDRKQGVLYYHPLPGEDMAQASR